MLVLGNVASPKTQFISVQVGCAFSPSSFSPSWTLAGFPSLKSPAAFLVIYSAYQPASLGAYWISDKNTVELDKQLFSSTMIPNDESKPIFARATWGWGGKTEMSSPVLTWLSAIWGQNVLCKLHDPKNTKRDTVSMALVLSLIGLLRNHAIQDLLSNSFLQGDS